jgi:hypothetical protein
MKVLIYGAKGWIGSQFVEIVKKAYIEYVEGILRIDDVKKLEKEIILVEPTHIVSFIGRT